MKKIPAKRYLCTEHMGTPGFTLLELMIVVSIIGILSAIVMVALGEARLNARDTHRLAQMQEVEKALALYYSDNSRYPAGGGSGETAPFAQTEIVSGVVNGGYLSSLPLDPKYSDPDAGYHYCSKSPYAGYVLLLNVESDNDDDAWCYISFGKDTDQCVNEATTNFAGVQCGS